MAGEDNISDLRKAELESLASWAREFLDPGKGNKLFPERLNQEGWVAFPFTNMTDNKQSIGERFELIIDLLSENEGFTASGFEEAKFQRNDPKSGSWGPWEVDERSYPRTFNQWSELPEDYIDEPGLDERFFCSPSRSWLCYLNWDSWGVLMGRKDQLQQVTGIDHKKTCIDFATQVVEAASWWDEPMDSITAYAQSVVRNDPLAETGPPTLLIELFPGRRRSLKERLADKKAGHRNRRRFSTEISLDRANSNYRLPGSPNQALEITTEGQTARLWLSERRELWTLEISSDRPLFSAQRQIHLGGPIYFPRYAARDGVIDETLSESDSILVGQTERSVWIEIHKDIAESRVLHDAETTISIDVTSKGLLARIEITRDNITLPSAYQDFSALPIEMFAVR